MVGINNRDLATFRTDLDVSIRLARRIPKGITVVSESGIDSRGDVVRLATAGIHAVLVGESLMREKDIGKKLRELLGGTGMQDKGPGYRPKAIRHRPKATDKRRNRPGIKPG